MGRGVSVNWEKRLFFLNDIKKHDEKMWNLNFIYVHWESELAKIKSIKFTTNFNG